MSIETVTLTVETEGESSESDVKVMVKPGQYVVDEFDVGEAVGILHPRSGGGVLWLPLAACGLTACGHCGGRGEWGYRVSVDEWESERCDSCDETGVVTLDVAAEQERQQAEQQREMYEAEGLI